MTMNEKKNSPKSMSRQETFCRDSDSLTGCSVFVSDGSTKDKWMTLVYVEGDTDLNFFSSIFDDEYVDIQKGKGNGEEGGKKNVLSAMRNVDSMDSKRKKRYVIAIIDSDFDRITGKDDTYKNDNSIFVTDTHDLETMQFREVKEKNLFQIRPKDYANLERIKEYGMTLADVWERVYDICVTIGKVRLMSEEKKLGLPITKRIMKDIEKKDNMLINDRMHELKDPVNFYFKKFLTICAEYTEDRIGDDNPGDKAYTYEDLKKYYEEYKGKEYDVWQICNGHDMQQVARRVFSKDVVGSRSGHKNDDFFEATLSREYILKECFFKTELYHDLVDWNLKHEKAKLFLQPLEAN